MEEDLLSNLPPEIVEDILTRLPRRSIAMCNCVCKSLRNLTGGDKFATLYSPKQAMVFGHQAMGYAVYDEACQLLFQFRLPPPHNQYSNPDNNRLVINSTDGLVLVWDELKKNHNILFICNPMTGEYIELPPLPATKCIFGFGVSKLSQQYKVLCIEGKTNSCHIYTLGGGDFWRSIEPPQAAPVFRVIANRVSCLDYALFLNGNLHWLVSDYDKHFLICCFDLETERFMSFSVPPPPREEVLAERFLMSFSVPPPPREKVFTSFFYGLYRMYILKGRLCLCDNTDYLIVVIWMMNNYGDTNSWVKEYEFSFQLSPDILYIVFPLKVLANGDLLFISEERVFIYSKVKRTCETYSPFPHRFGYCNLPNVTTYTSSFVPLKSMRISNVGSLSLCFDSTSMTIRRLMESQLTMVRRLMEWPSMTAARS